MQDTLGLKLNTFLKLTNQLISEQINSDKLVRRRTSQVEICFDLYFKQISETKPDISFFLLIMLHHVCIDIGLQFFQMIMRKENSAKIG